MRIYLSFEKLQFVHQSQLFQRLSGRLLSHITEYDNYNSIDSNKKKEEKLMRKLLAILLALAMCVSLFGCGAAQTPGTTPATAHATQPAAVNYEDVVILYTNDIHTYIDGAFTRFHSRMTSDEFCHKYCRLTKKEVKELCKVSPEGWIWENADTFRECYKLLDPSKDYHDLPEQNKLRMKEITDEMLVKAGYRLANVINEIFK